METVRIYDTMTLGIEIERRERYVSARSSKMPVGERCAPVGEQSSRDLPYANMIFVDQRASRRKFPFVETAR